MPYSKFFDADEVVTERNNGEEIKFFLGMA